MPLHFFELLGANVPGFVFCFLSCGPSIFSEFRFDVSPSPVTRMHHCCSNLLPNFKIFRNLVMYVTAFFYQGTPELAC